MIKTKRGRTERAKLIRQLDVLASRLVKRRDHNVCQYCGKLVRNPRGCHVHHIQGRTRMDLRHDFDNLVTLDYGHHRYVHSHPHQMLEWLAERFPERSRRLQEKQSRPVGTVSTLVLKDTLELLQEIDRQLDRLESR